MSVYAEGAADPKSLGTSALNGCYLITIVPIMQKGSFEYLIPLVIPVPLAFCLLKRQSCPGACAYGRMNTTIVEIYFSSKNFLRLLLYFIISYFIFNINYTKLIE